MGDRWGHVNKHRRVEKHSLEGGVTLDELNKIVGKMIEYELVMWMGWGIIFFNKKILDQNIGERQMKVSKAGR